MKQVRFTPIETCGLQVREAQEGEEQSRTVVGTPIVYGVRSNNLTPWSNYREVYEVLEPGCISDELLRNSDVVLNLNHSNKVTDILGRWRNGKGTLKLTNGERKMDAECDIAETNAGNDTMVLMRRGDISGMSFAFTDDDEDSENGVSYERMDAEAHDGKEVWVRHVKRITGLYDVSIVTHPAYEQTSVGTREQGDKMLAHIEDILSRQQQREQHEETLAEVADDNQQEVETDEQREARELEEMQQKERERIAQSNMRRAQRMHVLNEINLDKLFY